MGRMKPAEEDDFESSGAKHISTRPINWRNDEDRRCISACLVQATWVIENDKEREKRGKCKSEMAKPWYQSIGFELMEELPTGSIIDKNYAHGTIFKLMTTPRPEHAPEYVVAFRGTMLNHPNAYLDLLHDLKVVFSRLTTCTRVEEAHVSINRNIGDSTLWLAGHSLGASLALEIGRNMMLDKRGCQRNVPTFLFNPPHVSSAPVVNSVLKGKHKTRLYLGHYAVKYTLANIMPWNRKRSKKVFEELDSWCPDMYINPADFICVGHMDYFEQRQLVAEKHLRFASTGMRTSYRDIFFSGKLQPHLLPTARLWINTTQKDEPHPHGLKHWWMPELKLQRKFYQVPENIEQDKKTR
ncbi:GDSL esterase/lipase At4g10955-like [Hordeum vulgare subsp. vulgare]|uniref:Fungal lipase-like domain-containing protein n=1 Tax=Hordeum vulgare subsp. vulgare TaxID=112509 RepID=A0A8I6XKC4_HORVV|nr:GDSL esterase/lipase At4g10955-like [Hordeum vulgare subsp. vulgare]